MKMLSVMEVANILGYKSKKPVWKLLKNHCFKYMNMDGFRIYEDDFYRWINEGEGLNWSNDEEIQKSLKIIELRKKDACCTRAKRPNKADRPKSI